jgi:Fe-S oxidoreductase
MAGAFGYEEEHYAVSMRVAELKLLPAVLAAVEGSLIAAAGVSCQSQIADGTRREALHPARLLIRALNN